MSTRKKILMLSAYFPPEAMPTETLQFQLLDAFVDAGFSVRVLCPIPSRGIPQNVRAEYRHKKREELRNGSIVINRFYMPKEGRDPVSRALRYFRLNVMHYFKAVRVKDADLLFCASTPPTQGALCSLIKRSLKIPFVYNLQDIFPDSLVNAGMTNEGSRLWRIGRHMEDYTYRNADKIIAISHGGKNNIIAKGVPEEKVEVIYNWADTDQIVPVPRSKNKLFDDLGLDRSKFYITYAGNLGPAQNVGLLLDAAKYLDDVPDIQIIIFGSGSEQGVIADRAKYMSNVKIFPLMPKEKLSEVYSLGDMSLVIAKKGLGAASMPSKTWSILAAGTPVLLSFDEGSELWNLVEVEQLGVCADAGDAQKLAEGIVKVFSNQKNQELMAKKARAFAEGEVSFKASTGKYVMTLNRAISGAAVNSKQKMQVMS